MFTNEDIKEILSLANQYQISTLDISDNRGQFRFERKASFISTNSVTTDSLPVTDKAVDTLEKNKIIDVLAPMVGVFYSSPNPDNADYVKVGDHVDSSSVIGLVEAMKLFQEVEAGVSGTVIEILVENEAFVEQSQALFRIQLDSID
jgi:acetyl-CoA carboxylase biotin carboxyl carrier protein